MAAVTSVSFATWQQAEQTMVGDGVFVFKCPLSSGHTAHFTSVKDALYMVPVMSWVMPMNHVSL